MFSNRKRRANSNPVLNASNANPSATTAATQAFLRNRTSNSSLSSAAAAAALRSRPTSPTLVADVETKRTMRRSGSVSSNASVGSGYSPREALLERRGSSGSMSERTFRDPSPVRPSHVPSAIDAPPVPAIPEQHSQPLTTKTKSSKRAASMEAPIMRVASPPPQRTTGRGSSLGPAALPSGLTPAAQRRSLSNLSELTSIERPGSRGSVNFSYPTSSRPLSPTNDRQLTSPLRSRTPLPTITSPKDKKLVYDPNTRRFLPEAEVFAIQQEIEDATNMEMQAQGTHLPERTIRGSPHGTPVDTMAAAPAASAQSSRTKPQRQEHTVGAPRETIPAARVAPRRKKKVIVASESESDGGLYMTNSSDNESDAGRTYSRPGLVKKPSVVREDREREEQEDATPTRAAKVINARPVSPIPISASGHGMGHGKGRAQASAAPAQEREHKGSASQATSNSTDIVPVNGLGIATGTFGRGGRIQSVSPARALHFSNGDTSDNLVVRHHPPPRSKSPRKSAMKNSHSPRGSSPGRRLDHSQSPSEASTTADDQYNMTRRKAHRVSFDDSNTVVVGQAAPSHVPESSVIPSPQQTKRTWFKGIGKKKGVAEEDDETMKPRPVLPSFGSVREKKFAREAASDRPLVKPIETTQTQRTEVMSSPPTSANLTGRPKEQSATSTDQALGGILLSDALSQNTARLSESQGPSSLGITSKGTSEASDDDASDYSIDGKTRDAAFQDERAQIINGPAAQKQSTAQEDVPEINILQATPNLETSETMKDFTDMPGGSEGTNASNGSVMGGQERSRSITPTSEHHGTAVTPATVGIAEPPEPHTAGSPHVGEIATENLHHNAIMEEIEEDTEHDSVYSDAAEEFTDNEGDGFLSLDAVVESPVKSSMPGLAITTPPESPTIQLRNDKDHSQLTRQPSEPQIKEGWGKAQQYWSGLSAEKKQSKELHALVDNQAAKVVPTPAPKTRKKKVVSVEQPLVDSDRTYMIKPGSKMGTDGHTPVTHQPRKRDEDIKMRKSMRAGQPTPSAEPPVEQPHIRKSMRASAEPAPQSAKQPVSVPVTASTSKHRTTQSASTAGTAPTSVGRNARGSMLRRKSSSDSKSSFKRSRPANSDPSSKRSQPALESFSLRRSMRGIESSNANSSSRLSIRSLSPSGPRRASTSTTGQPSSMRGTMRNPGAGARTLRGRAKSPLRLPGFGGSSNKSQKPNGRQRSSRFADSSDEDDGGPMFNSRFADSSDEDEPLSTPVTIAPTPIASTKPSTTTPLRPILEPSTVPEARPASLPDSDDEKPTTNIRAPATRQQNGKTPATGQALSSGSLRRSGSGRGTLRQSTHSTTITAGSPLPRKRGFMSSILGRKKNNANFKVGKVGLESGVRRDTLLERSKIDLDALKRGEGNDASADTANIRTASPESSPLGAGGRPGKLQKRNTSALGTSTLGGGKGKSSSEGPSMWPPSGIDVELERPAPAYVTHDNSARPFSADGLVGRGGSDEKAVDGAALGNNNGRPDIGDRRVTATGSGNVDLKAGIPQREGRKKSAWRRFLGRD